LGTPFISSTYSVSGTEKSSIRKLTETLMLRRRKWLLAGLGTLFTVVIGPYVVEQIKGIPPGQLWAAARKPFPWQPFQSADVWLAAPAQISHGRVLLLSVALVLTLAALIGLWLTRTRPPNRLPADFNPNAVQMLAIDWLLKAHGSPQSLSTLEDRAKPLTYQLGGAAFLQRQMEDLERSGVVVNISADSYPLYELTTPGRDWWLDHLERGWQEQRLAQEVADFEPSETQRPAATVLLETYPRAMNVGQIRVAMERMTELNVIVPPQAEIARELENLARRNVIKIGDGAHPHYELTVPGRDFMLAYLDALDPPR
jgi:hypothetical protein